MCAGNEQMFNRIFVFDGGAFQALTASALSLISARRTTLDISAVANGNDHCLFGNQVIHIDVTEFDI